MTTDEQIARQQDVEQALRDGKIEHPDIVFYFDVEHKDKAHGDGSAVGEAYAVVKADRANSGLVTYAKFKGKWESNPWSDRPIIRRLLEQLDVL